uniref:LCN-type CS-alpha/beta domain-containing protein n=1 Tax=Isometrus maculatus TaxID=497827 RepID=A0A0U1SCE1_ISOMC|nr:hypothetical protein [Isometrus maculatus]
MNCCVLIVLSALLIGVQSKDGYLVGSDGCKISCLINDNYCSTECLALGADKGYCKSLSLACKCEGLPDEVEVWSYDTNTCST